MVWCSPAPFCSRGSEATDLSDCPGNYHLLLVLLGLCGLINHDCMNILMSPSHVPIAKCQTAGTICLSRSHSTNQCLWWGNLTKRIICCSRWSCLYDNPILEKAANLHDFLCQPVWDKVFVLLCVLWSRSELMKHSGVHDDSNIDYILTDLWQGIFRTNADVVFAKELVVTTETECVHWQSSRTKSQSESLLVFSMLDVNYCCHCHPQAGDLQLNQLISIKTFLIN